MAHINLLPWREKLRNQQKQTYLTVLVALGLGTAALFYLGGMVLDQQIDNQRTRNNYLQSQISILDAQIAQINKIKEQKDAIEKRMALIEQLQVSRNIAPAVLDELARIVPPGVSFKSLRRTKDQITIEGLSDSNNRLSNFMRALEQSTIFSAGELSSIVADTSASDAVSGYTLKFSILEFSLVQNSSTPATSTSAASTSNTSTSTNSAVNSGVGQ